MTIDFLHLYCKCPHCTTMFRAAVSDIDASQGWVKCGHCRKVFDCRKNEIKPEDFVKADEPVEDEADENEQVEQASEAVSIDDAHSLDEQESAPQISLFDESDQPEKPNAGGVVQTNLDKSVKHRLSANLEVKSAKTVEQKDDSLPRIEQKPGYTVHRHDVDAVNLHLDRGDVRTPAADKKTLEANRQTDGVTSLGRVKKENKNPQRSILKRRLTITKPQAPAFSEIILSKAKSWKKQKNRFKKTKAFPLALITVALFALLIWQIAIVNYSRLLQYSFLSAPLAAVCSIVTCNRTAVPQGLGFEILHASVRRHASIPNVMSVSAKLINFSDENRMMPTLRLDLTNDNKAVIASRIIKLPDNPQFVDPALTELAPGQDVQLLFNIKNPDKSAHGFQLNLVSDPG